MDCRDVRRLELTKEAHQMMRHPEIAAMYPAAGADGVRTIVVALTDDLLGSLYETLALCSPPINVLVAAPTEPSARDVITIHPADALVGEGDDCSVDPRSDVGMLVAALRLATGPLRCSLVKSEVDAELMPQPVSPS